MTKGKTDEAIAEYRKAIDLDPEAGLPHYKLGIALRDQGKTDEAIAEYRKAIELDPKDASFHTDLARILKKQGKTARGVQKGQGEKREQVSRSLRRVP